MPSSSDSLAEQFHRDFRPALVAYFLRRLGNRSEAEDLAHDVYVRLASRPANVADDLNAYIFQIAANLLRDRMRRSEVRERYAAAAQRDFDNQVDPLDPHRVAAGREAVRALVRALDNLPERTRQIFLLYRYEQISRPAIAESFGISVSAVEKHLHRAMVRLGDSLGGSK